MNDVKNIVFNCIEIFTEDQSFLFELSKSIEFIDQPSHHENETLDLTNELVSNVYVTDSSIFREHFRLNMIRNIFLIGIVRLLNLWRLPLKFSFEQFTLTFDIV